MLSLIEFIVGQIVFYTEKKYLAKIQVDRVCECTQIFTDHCRLYIDWWPIHQLISFGLFRFWIFLFLSNSISAPFHSFVSMDGKCFLLQSKPFLPFNIVFNAIWPFLYILKIMVKNGHLGMNNQYYWNAWNVNVLPFVQIGCRKIFPKETANPYLNSNGYIFIIG